MMKDDYIPKYVVRVGLNTVLPNDSEIQWIRLWERGKFPKVIYGLRGVTVKTSEVKIFVTYSNLSYIKYTKE